MNDTPAEPYLMLIKESLIAWRLLAKASRGDDGSILVSGLGRDIRIDRAPADAPFRWLITIDKRQRPALSIVSVLRQVRGALDAGYAQIRVRVAPPVTSSPGPRP